MPDPRPVPPLDPPMVPFAIAGTAIWAAAGGLLLITGGPPGTLWTCLAGFLIGGALTLAMAVRDRTRRANR